MTGNMLFINLNLTLTKLFYNNKSNPNAKKNTSQTSTLKSNQASCPTVLNNNPRNEKVNLAAKAMDKGPVKKVVGLSVELQHYEDGHLT